MEHEAEELAVLASRGSSVHVPTAGLPLPAEKTEVRERRQRLSQLSLGHIQGSWGDEEGWVLRGLRLRKISERSTWEERQVAGARRGGRAASGTRVDGQGPQHEGAARRKAAKGARGRRGARQAWRSRSSWEGPQGLPAAASGWRALSPRRAALVSRRRCGTRGGLVWAGRGRLCWEPPAPQAPRGAAESRAGRSRSVGGVREGPRVAGSSRPARASRGRRSRGYVKGGGGGLRVVVA